MPRFSTFVALLVFLTAWLVSGVPVRAAAGPGGGGLERAVSQSAALEPADITAVIFRVDWLLIFPREHQAPKVAAGSAGGILLIQERCDRIESIIDGGTAVARRVNLAMTGEVNQTRGDQTTQTIPLYDGTGHVVALTDLNQNLLAEYAYGPFGEPIHATGPHAQANPWRYATKYLDEETGLYYFGHRYYDPVTGQWLSREPLGESESINLYSYCHNDPVNKVDVLGLAGVMISSDSTGASYLYQSLLSMYNSGPAVARIDTRDPSIEIDRLAIFIMQEMANEFEGRLHDNTGPGYQTYGRRGNRLGTRKLPFFQDGNGRIGCAAISHNLEEFRNRWTLTIYNACINSHISEDGFHEALDLLNDLNTDLRNLRSELGKSGYEPAMARYRTESRRDFAFALGDAALLLIPVPGTESLAAWRLSLLGRGGVAARTTPSSFARAQQGSGAYPGIDRWRDITLKKGTIIYGGEPGQSAFYTTRSAIGRTGDSATDIFQGLQVAPHLVHGYRPALTAYEVIDDIPAAFGRSLANPQHGAGGLPQIVVPDFSRFLRPIHTAPLSP